MVGIVIATHGELANGLVNSLELIMGKQKNYATIGLFHGDSVEMFSETLEEKVHELDDGSGVLILTDLFSATPYNRAAYLINQEKEGRCNIQLLSGVNLPMLVQAFNCQLLDQSLEAMIDTVESNGKLGIKNFDVEMKKIAEGGE